MPKKKGDIEIGRRAFEEVYRIFHNYEKAARVFGCSKRLFYAWNDGETPGGHYLALLHYFGGDVIYILTGHRKQ